MKIPRLNMLAADASSESVKLPEVIRVTRSAHLASIVVVTMMASVGWLNSAAQNKTPADTAPATKAATETGASRFNMPSTRWDTTANASSWGAGKAAFQTSAHGASLYGSSSGPGLNHSGTSDEVRSAAIPASGSPPVGKLNSSARPSLSPTRAGSTQGTGAVSTPERNFKSAGHESGNGKASMFRGAPALRSSGTRARSGKHKIARPGLSGRSTGLAAGKKPARKSFSPLSRGAKGGVPHSAPNW